MTIQVRISGLGAARVRLWLAAQVLKLEGLIGGTRMDVSVGPPPEFDDVSPEHRRYFLVGEIEVAAAASVDEKSPLFAPNIFEWAPLIDILLDGALQDRVVAYDVDRGFVRVYPSDDVRSFGDRVATEVRRGRVEIVAKRPN